MNPERFAMNPESTPSSETNPAAPEPRLPNREIETDEEYPDVGSNEQF